MFEVGRVTVNGEDLTNEEGDVICPSYLPDVDVTKLSTADQEKIVAEATNNSGKVVVWLVGACVQEVVVMHEDTPVKLIGIDPLNDKHTITMSDVCSIQL